MLQAFSCERIVLLDVLEYGNGYIHIASEHFDDCEFIICFLIIFSVCPIKEIAAIVQLHRHHTQIL